MRTLAIALVATFVSVSLFADAGMWGSRGISRRFIVKDNLVFAADGRGLAVYDVSSPASIQRIAVSQTNAESLDVAFSGPSAVALLTRGGINLYAFSPNGALTLTSVPPLSGSYSQLASSASHLAGVGVGGVTIWSPSADSLGLSTLIPIEGTVNAIAFHGDELLVAVDGQGVFTYDPSGDGPRSFLPANAQAIAVQNDTLYIAAGSDGLVIADVSDDDAPAIISRTGAGSLNLNRIAVSGSRIYATELSDVLHVYDGTSLGQPLLVSTVQDESLVLAAAGNRLFLSGAFVDAFGLRDETGIPLRVYDVTDPAAPRIAGDFRDLAGPVSGVATDGTVAYVVDPPFFRVIDVSSPAAATELASLQVPGLQDRVKVSGQRAIVYGRGDVDLFDISNPRAPKFLGVFHSLGHPPSNAAFAGAGNTIVEGNPNSGFHVIDFDRFGPADPVQISGVKGHFQEVVGLGPSAYLLGFPTGLVIVDLSVQGEATTTDTLPTNSVQAEVVPGDAVRPDLLVVGLPDGMRIFNLADRLHPVDLGVATSLPHGVPFASSGGTSYLATDGTMTAMTLPGGMVTPTAMVVSSPMQVAVAANGKIVIADRYSLRIYGPATAAPPPPPPPPPLPRRRPAGHP